MGMAGGGEGVFSWSGDWIRWVGGLVEWDSGAGICFCIEVEGGEFVYVVWYGDGFHVLVGGVGHGHCGEDRVSVCRWWVLSEVCGEAWNDGVHGVWGSCHPAEGTVCE